MLLLAARSVIVGLASGGALAMGVLLASRAWQPDAGPPPRGLRPRPGPWYIGAMIREAASRPLAMGPVLATHETLVARRRRALRAGAP